MNPQKYTAPVSKSRVIALVLSLLALPGSLSAHQPGTSPVKIFIMAGQSNTEGYGLIDPATPRHARAYRRQRPGFWSMARAAGRLGGEKRRVVPRSGWQGRPSSVFFALSEKATPKHP